MGRTARNHIGCCAGSVKNTENARTRNCIEDANINNAKQIIQTTTYKAIAEITHFEIQKVFLFKYFSFFQV